MQNLSPAVQLIFAALAGLLLGAMALYFASRRWIAGAHASGRSSRDAEVATLTVQHDAATGRSGEMAARIERYERDWSVATQSLNELSARAAKHEARADHLIQELAGAQREGESARVSLADMASKRADELRATDLALEQAKAARDAAVRAYEQAKAFLDEAQAKMRTAFIEAASKVFDEKSASLDRRIHESGETSKVGLQETLKPFSEKVAGFQTRIEQFTADHARDCARLEGTIGELKLLNQGMADAASALTTALKGNVKTRGDWGEMILETVLKSSGLEEGVTYSRQTAVWDEDSGRPRLPDVVVNLPDGRQVVVDSKVNLIAWAEANEAGTPAEYQEALVRHASALRSHVKDLAKKNYPRALGANALDMTILFVPIEGALSAALGVNHDLQLEAFSKKIAFASPNTLMLMLKVVERLWMRDKLQKQVHVIGAEAGKLLDALAAFIEDFNRIEDRIKATGDAFETAKKRLNDSNQSVAARARRLVEAGARGKRQLPEELQPVPGFETLPLITDLDSLDAAAD